MDSNSAYRLIARLVAVFVAAMMTSGMARAQTARISGFVTDRTNGQALEAATVALYRFAEGFEGAPAYGMATNPQGLYIMSRIESGRYLLQISFVGYRAHRDTLTLAADDIRTVTVALEPDPEALAEVVVEAERTHGVARVTAGHQRIRPEEIQLIPAPDISADLANYLTTLPGVVTTGDRGGQFFVRGGEPSQNLVFLDGMIVYQPFHLLGFYSAFPSEIIDRVDLYAGGFGAKYAGRLSSVMDVSARPGNNRRFAGMASGSPSMSAVSLEGPIVPGRASLLFSARESFIDRTGERLTGQELPFQFGDLFGKIHVAPGPRHRFSATILRTHDEGVLVREVGDDVPQDLRWTNTGGSFRWLLLPRSLPVSAEFTLSRARHEMEQGTPGDPARTTVIQDTRVALDATYSEGSFFGGRSTTAAGWEFVLGRARNELGGLFQNVEDRNSQVPSFGVYVEPELTTEGGLRIRPGMRLQWYNVRNFPYPEPRLNAEWELGIHHLSGAIGLFNQQVLGLNDRRDAASVFTAWAGIPRVIDRPPRTRDVRRTENPRTFEVRIRENVELERIGDELLRGRIGSAAHALLGYRSAPSPWIEVAVEGFYKRSSNLFVGEITPLPRLTTRLLPATGRSFGFEARVELRRRPAYAFITYGFSNTVYTADGRVVSLAFETERLRYRPAHDRRHQVNTLASLSAGGFEFSVRWQFGSGLPYTRPLAFDGFALVDDTHSAFNLQHSRRVIYDRPFGSLLPTFHRLDASIERTWHLRAAEVTLQASAINIYDRRNIFFVDIFTLERKDQLPFVPSLGLKVAFQ